MHRTIIILLAAVLLIDQRPGWTQTGPTVVKHGMFGPRVLGAPLQPKASTFADNFEFGPSGNFQGIRNRFTPPPLPSPVILPAPDAILVYQTWGTPLASPVPAFIEPPGPLVAQPSRPAPPPAGPPVAPVQPTPVPQAAEPANAEPTNTQELPLRRAPGAAAGTAAAPVATAAEAPMPVGPQAISPLQTPGGTYTTFRTDFAYARPAPDQLGSRLTWQLNNSPRLQARSPLQVSVQGQTAILRGTVATAHDRTVAEQAVRMEAGIWNVDNQLKVIPSQVSAQP